MSDGYPDYGNSRTESVLRLEPLTDVSVGEILDEAIGLEPGRWTRGDQMRMSAYLRLPKRLARAAEDFAAAATGFKRYVEQGGWVS